LLLLGLLGVASTTVGCTFLAARPQVRLAEEARVIRGTIGGVRDAAVLIVALREPDLDPVDFFVAKEDGAYYLLVPPGRYRVLAFEDRNGDRILQPDEAAVRLPHENTVIDTSERFMRTGVDGRVSREPAGDARFAGLPVDLSNPDLDHRISLGISTPGSLASLDDPRFSRENASKGYWKPIDFIRESHGGLFLLGPHDPGRIPVLFVHGAQGSPLEFASLIEALDRETFEPWVFYYPSALRLEPVADFLNVGLTRLHAELEFDRLFVVAHSMGGLVARALLNDFQTEGKADWIPLFVSLATPWQGHMAAGAGVERSPVVVPSWRDMAPSSPFLQALLEAPLSGETRFHLLFSFAGHRGRDRAAGANDGVVTVKSQLAPRAQNQASGVHGFPTSHTGILRDPAVAEELGALLRSAARR